MTDSAQVQGAASSACDVAACDGALAALIEDGEYDRLYRRWFGASPGSETHPYPPPGPRKSLPEPAGRWARILKRRTLRIGFAVLGPPFSAEVDGRVEGWDLDLAQALGRRMGRLYGVELMVESVRLPAAPFPAGLLEGLDEGRVDALLSDLAVTAQRARRVDFSAPYLRATFGLLCRDSAVARRLHCLEAADRPEVSLVVLRRAFLNELADACLPRARRVWVDDPVDILPALSSGQADAALLPYASIRAFLRDRPGTACPEFSIGPGAVRAVAWPKS